MERVVSVELQGKVSGFINAMAQAKQAASDVNNEIKKAASEHPQQLREVANAFTAVGLAAAAAAGLAIAKWANFDEAMSAVQAATHESEGSMRLLEAAALDAGARTVFSATEAANAIEELAKAGVSTKDILAGGLDGALDLAAAGGLGVADAAGIAATALKTFNLEGSDMAHVADLLAAGAGKAMGDVTDLSAALNQSAMVANATGLSIEETTAGLAAFASQGLLGSDAGTSFKSMLQSLTPTSEKARSEMERLGISAYDSQGNFIGLAEFAGNLQNALKGLSTEQQQAALKTIFGSDAIRAATVLYSEGEAGIRKWEAAVNDQGYAAETAAARLDNLKGDLEALGGAFDTMLIKLGSSADGPLRSMVQWLTELVDGFSQLPEPVQSFTMGAILLTAGLGLLGGALMHGTIKLAEFKVALATVAPAGSTTRAALSSLTGFLGGPWGAALAAASLAVIMLNREIEKGVPTQESIKNALLSSANAADAFAAAGKRGAIETTLVGDYAAELKDLGKLLDDTADKSLWGWFNQDFVDTGALDSVSRIGEVLAEIASTDMSQASGEFRRLAESQNLTEGQMSRMLDEMPAFKDALISQATELGLTADESTLLALALGEIGPAAEDGASGADSQADSLSTLEQTAADAQSAISDLADEVRGFGSAAFDTREANRKLEDSYAKLAEGLAVNGANFDITNEAGREMQSMLDNVASSTNQAAAAILDQTGSQEEMNAKLAEGRQRLIDILAPYLGSAEAAAQYVDQLDLISPQKVSEIVANTQQATSDVLAFQSVLGTTPNEKWTKLFVDRGNSAAQLEAHLSALRNIPAYKSTVIETVMRQTGAPRGQVGAAYNANGGFYGYANGGMLSYADGGMAPGIFRGRPGSLYKFAEPETRWEAFISGKPGMEARNTKVWAEAGSRLGVFEDLAKMLGGLSQPAGERNMNFTFVNPVARDPFQDAWERAQEVGTDLWPS